MWVGDGFLNQLPYNPNLGWKFGWVVTIFPFLNPSLSTLVLSVCVYAEIDNTITFNQVTCFELKRGKTGKDIFVKFSKTL